MLLLLLLPPPGCLLGEGDAQGLGCGADREAPKSGRKRVGWGFHWQDGGFLRVELLPSGPAKCCESNLKSLRTTLCARLEEIHAVIGKMGGKISLTSKLQTHL